MKNLWLAIFAFILLIPASASAQYIAVNLPCEQGAKGLAVTTIMVAGLNTPTNLVGSYPLATANIYNTGTLTLSMIYSNSTGSVLSNPTSCDSTGYLHFFVASGTYDITFSGNVQQLQLNTPFTLSSLGVGGETSSIAIGDAVSGSISGLDLNVNSANQLSQVPNIIHTEQLPGADCGVRFTAAQTALTNGGTIDMSGEVNCTSGTLSMLRLGDGVHNYRIIPPTPTITMLENGTLGTASQICYNSHIYMWAYGTTLVSPGDVNPILGPCYAAANVSYPAIYGLNISVTGSVVPGSIAFSIGGPNGNQVLFPPATGAAAYNGSTIAKAGPFGQFFTGSIARVAFYNGIALSAATIATNYANHTNLATYDAGILASSPSCYWKLNETTGTTAADASGNGCTATYVGGVTLGVANGINGSADHAPVFDGSTGYVNLNAPGTGPDITGNTFTYTVWANASVLQAENQMLYLGNTGGGSFITFTDNPSNNKIQVVVLTPTSGGLQSATQPQLDLPVNTWVELDVVYKNGGVIMYYNGAPLRIGTDVSHGTFKDIVANGTDYGCGFMGEHGANLQNMLENPQCGGASAGVVNLNFSGFPGDTNSDTVISPLGTGPICIYDFGGISTRWMGPADCENNTSPTGAVIFAEPDVLSPGTGYLVGDTITGTGCSVEPTFKVNLINASGGIIQGTTTPGLTVLTRGSGCSNGTNISTTGGTGTGATINQHTHGSIIAIGYSSHYDMPYLENDIPPYVCGGGNVFLGSPSGVIAGSIFAPTPCPGDPGSGWWKGPNAASPYDAFQSTNSGMGYGLNGFLYDQDATFNFQSTNQNGAECYPDGCAYAYNSAVTDSLWGWFPHNSGTENVYGSAVVTGQSSFGPIANPSLTIAVGCTAGGGLTCTTQSADYGLVFFDWNSGHTIVSSPSVSTANGPSALGAIETLAVYNSCLAFASTPACSGFTSGTVGETCTITGGDGTGEVTITSVSGGKVTGVSTTSGNLGTKYNTQPYPGGGGSNIFPTVCGTGSNLNVVATSSYLELSWTPAHGINHAYVTETDTGHRLQIPSSGVTGSTDTAANIFDFGGNYTTVSWDTLLNTSGNVIMKSLAQLVKTAFANLPTCASAFQGYYASVSDSTTNTWGATITGSGGDAVGAYCDGANWTVFAK